MSLLAYSRSMLEGVRHAGVDAVLVGLSGGKDSLTTLDLCVQVFPRVECYYMYLVDGLACVETGIYHAVNRYKVKLHKVPHFDLINLYRSATFRWHLAAADNWTAGKYTEVEAYVRHVAGIEWTVTGQRMDESLERRGMLTPIKGLDWRHRRVYPLWRWVSRDVFAYLRARRIPLPEDFGKGARGVAGMSLSAETLRYLKAEHPADYAKVLEVFPFAEAQVKRLEWYGETDET